MEREREKKNGCTEFSTTEIGQSVQYIVPENLANRQIIRLNGLNFVRAYFLK